MYNTVIEGMACSMPRKKMAFALVALMFLFIFAETLWAQQDALSERGIDPKILDVMISSLSQDVRFTGETEITIVSDERTMQDRALVFFEPSTEYGIDLYMKFEEGETETMAPRKFRKYLENRMKLQHTMRTMEFGYDPSTIEVESQEGDKAVIKFRYQNWALPQEVAWMRHLQGRIWVEGNQVRKINLTLDPGRTFWLDGILYSSMDTTAEFTRVSDGRDLLKSTSNTATAKYYGLKLFKWGTQFTLNLDTTVLSYVDENGTVLFGDQPDSAVASAAKEDLETVRVNLDRKFPIWGKEVRKRGFDLPRAWGLSLLYTDMNTDMDFTSFEINGEQEAIEAIFDPDGSGISVNATNTQVRGDLFVLPFLNVMLLGGTADATGSLTINTTELGEDFIGLPPTLTGDVDLDLTMGGVGLATAVGYKNFFAAIAATYMVTLTSGADTESEILSFTPLMGYQFLNARARLMFGVEYLDMAKTMEGSIPLDDGEVLDFRIGVDQEAWAYRVGVMKEFGSHWEGMFSYSWGDTRDGWTVLWGYRW